MASVTGLTVTKSFPYRGDVTEEFSNTYHFKNAPPTTTAQWDGIRQSMVTAEQALFPASVKWTRVYGYNSNDPNAHHVYAFDYGAAGPPGAYIPSPADEHLMAGDQAVCLAWKTDRLNSRGKPIYLRKYFHSAYTRLVDPDAVTGEWINKGNAFGAGAVSIQTVWGGLRSRSTDDNVVSFEVLPWVTTRTLKRRGKRPKTGS